MSATDASGGTTPAAVAPGQGGQRRREGGSSPRRLMGRGYSWLRWLHVYVSAGSFLLILFFALTGVTLNHPEWSVGTEERVESFEGVLPEGWRSGDDFDWLVITEHLRGEHGVRGRLADYRADDFDGSLAFRAPGYLADAFFDPDTGAYSLAVVSAGPIGVLNALHRGGEASGPLWRFAIDLSGAILAIVAFTGLGLLLLLNRFRAPGLLVFTVGGVVGVVLMLLAG